MLNHTNQYPNSITGRSSFRLVNLNDLELKTEFAGNDLAENRFFLSQLADQAIVESDYIGVIPARWNERFVKWPKIENLPKLVERMNPKSILAPSASLIWGKYSHLEWERQELVHPGISTLLDEVEQKWFKWSPVKRNRTLSVYGNSFVVSSEVFSEFLKFWRSVFDETYSKYKFNLPFYYRCADCGLKTTEGIGRYSSSRHAGYFFERVTSMYFMHRQDLNLLKHQGVSRMNPIELMTGFAPKVIGERLNRKFLLDSNPRLLPGECRHDNWL